MALAQELRHRARHLVPQVLAICLVGYFAFHAIQGDRGVLAYMRLQESLNQTEAVLAELKAQRQSLAHRVSLLQPDNLDPDLLEERAREILNFARPDEVVILRESARPSPPTQPATGTADRP